MHTCRIWRKIVSPFYSILFSPVIVKQITTGPSAFASFIWQFDRGCLCTELQKFRNKFNFGESFLLYLQLSCPHTCIFQLLCAKGLTRQQFYHPLCLALSGSEGWRKQLHVWQQKHTREWESKFWTLVFVMLVLYVGQQEPKGRSWN